MSGILLSAPFTIPPTYLSWFLMRRVADYARQKHNIVSLEGPLASKLPYLAYLRLRPDLDVLLYGGHGTEDAWVGDFLWPFMFEIPDTIYVKGKILVAVPCCLSAVRLGPAAIERGAKCFIGATAPMYAAFDNEDHKYFEDWCNYHLALYKALLDGETAGNALSIYKERARYYLSLYQQHPDWADSDWHAYATEQNINVVTLLGDPGARISQEGALQVDYLKVLKDILTSFSPLLLAGIALAPAILKGIRRG